VKTRLTALLASLAVPTTALAHPGHGTTEPDSWAHYLTEPLHVAVIAAAVSLALGVGLAWRRSRRASRATAAGRGH
jgi:putative copper export protein